MSCTTWQFSAYDYLCDTPGYTHSDTCMFIGYLYGVDEIHGLRTNGTEVRPESGVKFHFRNRVWPVKTLPSVQYFYKVSLCQPTQDELYDRIFIYVEIPR